MKALCEVATLRGHEARVWNLQWCPDGSCLASCSGDKTVRLWEQTADGETWRCKAVLENSHDKTIRCVAWSPGGTSLATAGFDGKTVIWRRTGGRWAEVAHLEGHENEVKSVAFSTSGSLLATCGRDKTVWIWESFPGDDYECVDVKQGHTADVKSVAWHPTSGVLASASYDNTVKLWREDADGSEWYCAQTLEGMRLGHDSTVWSLAFETAGTLLATGSDDRTIKVWHCREQGGEPLYTLQATLAGYHERAVYSVAWSRDKRIASASGDNGVRVFEQQGEGGAWECVVVQHSAHDQDVNCVAWHPSSADLLASCGDDGLIKLWRVAVPDGNAGSANP